MKKLLLIALCVMAIPQFLLAQAGTTGLTFLKLGVGGRSLGMGEAYSAIASDPTAMYYNPAALSLSKTPQLLLMHKSWVQDTKSEYIAAKSAVGNFDFGLAVNSISVDNIEYRTIPGPAQGTFSAKNAAIGFSATYSFDTSFALGATVNYLYEKIFIAEASGTGFNLGAIYSTPFNVRLAFAVNNLGSMGVLDSAASELPASIRFGAGRSIPLENFGTNSALTLAADYVRFTTEKTNHLHFGGELDYERVFAIRAGYVTGYEARSFTAGIGVRYSLLSFDYAFAPFRDDLGTTHTFSLGFDF